MKTRGREGGWRFALHKGTLPSRKHRAVSFGSQRKGPGFRQGLDRLEKLRSEFVGDAHAEVMGSHIDVMYVVT